MLSLSRWTWRHDFFRHPTSDGGKRTNVLNRPLAIPMLKNNNYDKIKTKTIRTNPARSGVCEWDYCARTRIVPRADEHICLHCSASCSALRERRFSSARQRELRVKLFLRLFSNKSLFNKVLPIPRLNKLHSGESIQPDSFTLRPFRAF